MSKVHSNSSFKKITSTPLEPVKVAAKANGPSVYTYPQSPSAGVSFSKSPVVMAITGGAEENQPDESAFWTLMTRPLAFPTGCRYPELLRTAVLVRCIAEVPENGDPICIDIPREELLSAIDTKIKSERALGNMGPMFSHLSAAHHRFKKVTLEGVSCNYPGELLVAAPNIPQFNQRIACRKAEVKAHPFRPTDKVLYQTFKAKSSADYVEYATRIPAHNPKESVDEVIVFYDGVKDQMNTQDPELESFIPEPSQFTAGLFPDFKMVLNQGAQKVSDDVYVVKPGLLQHAIAASVPKHERRSFYNEAIENASRNQISLADGELPVRMQHIEAGSELLYTKVFDQYPPHNIPSGFKLFVAPPPCRVSCDSASSWTCPKCNVVPVPKDMRTIRFSAEVVFELYIAAKSHREACMNLFAS